MRRHGQGGLNRIMTPKAAPGHVCGYNFLILGNFSNSGGDVRVEGQIGWNAEGGRARGWYCYRHRHPEDNLGDPSTGRDRYPSRVALNT